MNDKKIAYQEICFNGTVIKNDSVEECTLENNSEILPNDRRKYRYRLLLARLCSYIGYLDAMHGLDNYAKLPDFISTSEVNLSLVFTHNEKEIIMDHYKRLYKEGLTALKRSNVIYNYNDLRKALVDEGEIELENEFCKMLSTYPDFDENRATIKKRN